MDGAALVGVEKSAATGGVGGEDDLRAVGRAARCGSRPRRRPPSRGWRERQPPECAIARAERIPEVHLHSLLDRDSPAREQQTPVLPAVVARVDRERPTRRAGGGSRTRSGSPDQAPSRTTTRLSLTTPGSRGRPPGRDRQARGPEDHEVARCRPRSTPLALQVQREGRVHGHRRERLLEERPHPKQPTATAKGTTARAAPGSRRRRGRPAHPAAIRLRAGAKRPSAGRRPRSAAAWRRKRPREGPHLRAPTRRRGSAERAPSSAASSAPPCGQLVALDPQLQAVPAGREQDSPALVTLKTPSSQKTSAKTARSRSATRGSSRPRAGRRIARGRAVLARTSCAPRNVGRRSRGDGTRRDGSPPGSGSRPVSRPYPLFTSAVVVPQRSISSSLAARAGQVLDRRRPRGLDVRTMPPPSAAISW